MKKKKKLDGTITTDRFVRIECVGPGGSYVVPVPKGTTLTITKDGYPINLSMREIRADVAGKYYGEGESNLSGDVPEE